MKTKEERALRREKRKQALWRPRNIHNVTPENDIKFRGVLSYRHLRIIAWVLLAVAQIGVLLKFGEKLYNNPGMYGNWPDGLSIFSSMMSPLFLIAAFAVVLNAKDGYRRLMIMQGGLSLFLFLFFIFAYEHYVVGTFNVIDSSTSRDIAYTLFTTLSTNGFFAFNIFIDLLLCTLITFFINYNPKKCFKGKNIIIFRLFALLPIAYEIVCIALKMNCSLGNIVLHPYVYPLLSTKPPLAFIIFIVMAIFVKVRERHYIKKGKTHADYKAFLHTNVNSFHFSAFLALTILVVAILDFLVWGALFIHYAKMLPADLDEQTYYICVVNIFNTIKAWGIGKCIPMILIIPIIIFFDYKKVYKDGLMDLFVPLIGIGLLVIVYVEGGYLVCRNWIANVISDSQSEKEAASLAVAQAKELFRKK